MRTLFPKNPRSLARPRATRARRVSLECLEGRELLTAIGVPSGLVSWWTADNTAVDLKGLNNAHLYNGATFAAGKVGQAFSFDGVNDRAQVADSDSLKLTGSMTIEGWILVRGFPAGSPSDHGEIFFRGDDRGGLDPYSLSVEPDGKLYFQVTNSSNASTTITAPVTLGQFIHVAATLDDATGTMKLYENGTVVAQTVTTIRPFRDLDPASNPSIGIGNHGGYPSTPHNFPFNGLIDELSVYNQAVTAGEIQGIYSAGSSGKIRSSSYFAADYPGVVEGPAGTSTPVTFTINRVGSLAGQAVVNWTTADGTATAGTDYAAASGQVVFQDGESQKTVQVTVNGDNTQESDETFWLALSTTTPGYAAGGGLATIQNDDVSITVSDAQSTEGDPQLGSLGSLVIQDMNGGLNRSSGMTFGPDGNLYVASINTNEVLRYDGTTGVYMGPFVVAGSGGLIAPATGGLIFRPDGKLYVLSRDTNSVLRYDAATGAFLDTFVPANSGGLQQPRGMIFGPDGNLYVGSTSTNQVLRYNGTTGAFLGVFVAAGSGGLTNPRAVTFGPDGNMYVSSPNTNSVLKFSGTTGAFLSTFIPSNTGDLNQPGDLLFVSSNLYVASQGNNQVLRYEAATGTFLGVGVAAGDNGLDRPIGLLLDSSNNLLVGSFAEILRYGPPSPSVFTVTLSGPSTSPVSVDYTTANGTASAGGDYVAISGNLTFAPGETTKTVRVPVTNDALAESTETFTVILSSPVGATIADGQGLATILDDDATKFFVVNDATSGDRTYEYGSLGGSVENYALNSGNTAPRGAASTAAGTTVWVVDANKKVYVYNNGGGLLGSWTAGTLTSNAVVEGVATNGTDVWIVDAQQDKVFRYTNAASRLSGTQNAASSFSLNASNASPKDIVTDGTYLWVVNDSTTDKVFKYSLTGSLLGSWTIAGAGTSPTGITLNPTGGGQLWIVDNGTDRVYQFDNARGLTSGSLWPSTSFALAAGNTNPQGIADPPAPKLSATAPGLGSTKTGRSSILRVLASSSPSGRQESSDLIPLTFMTDADLSALAAEVIGTGTKRAGKPGRR